MKARAFFIPFAVALTLYISTLAPTITWANQGTDGGDLIVASMVNGVPHPPGYPTYVTLGYLFAQLPIGSIAYRFNLMSALCMALATGVISITIARTSPTRSVLAPIVASLFFATAPMVWGQAIITEVYALNALLVALIVFCLAPNVQQDEVVPAHRMTIAALLWGLALGNSVTIAALAPLMLLAWWRADLRGRSWSIIAFCGGLSIYVLVPLRAASNPVINWGHAITWPEFAAQVSAEMYRGYLFAMPDGGYLRRLLEFAQLMLLQFGSLGIVLIVLGMWRALREHRRLWPVFVLTIALYGLFVLTYNTIDSFLYLIPVWLFAAWPIAHGLWFVVDGLSSRVRFSPQPSAVIFLCILVLGPVLHSVATYADMNLREDRTAQEFAYTVLTQTPRDAILLTQEDAQTFTLWYYRFLEGQRPDIAIVDTRMAGYPWYEPMLAAQGHALNLPDYDPTDTWRRRFANLNPGRRICEIGQGPNVHCAES